MTKNTKTTWKWNAMNMIASGKSVIMLSSSSSLFIMLGFTRLINSYLVTTHDNPLPRQRLQQYPIYGENPLCWRVPICHMTLRSHDRIYQRSTPIVITYFCMDAKRPEDFRQVSDITQNYTHGSCFPLGPHDPIEWVRRDQKIGTGCTPRGGLNSQQGDHALMVQKRNGRSTPVSGPQFHDAQDYHKSPRPQQLSRIAATTTKTLTIIITRQ